MLWFAQLTGHWAGKPDKAAAVHIHLMNAGSTVGTGRRHRQLGSAKKAYGVGKTNPGQ